MLASYLISKYSGQSYVNFIQTRIFTPLQMSSTSFPQNQTSHPPSPSHPHSRRQNLSQSWTQNKRRIPFWFSNPVLGELNSGPAAIISNVEDMIRWVQVLLGEGVDFETKEIVIPKSVFQEITNAQVIVDSHPNSEVGFISGYGMGWMREGYRGFDVRFFQWLSCVLI